MYPNDEVRKLESFVCFPGGHGLTCRTIERARSSRHLPQDVPGRAPRRTPPRAHDKKPPAREDIGSRYRHGDLGN